MIFQNISPCDALKEYVSLYRIRHFILPPNFGSIPKPYPPHPEQCFIFYPRGAEMTNFPNESEMVKRPRSVLTGQFTRRIDRRSVYNEILIILVVFRPGALHRITGIPFKILINRVVDLEAIYPKKAREVNDRLGSSDDYEEMIGIIETFLLELTANPKVVSRPSDKIFEFIASNKAAYSLDWLAREACLSSRQFERKSQDYIGVSPKYFGRIARFTQTYYMGMQKPHPDWLDISISCGYNDYQHLVKDYKEFTGVTPRNFLEEESKSLERALGLNQ